MTSRLFAALVAVLLLTLAVPVLAHGQGSPVECKTPHETSGDPVATYTAFAGWTITGVCIKAGQLHTAPLGNGTHFDGCYLVEGVGSSTVTVTRLLGGSGCQEISHVDVVQVPPPVTTEPEDTTTTVDTTITTPPNTVPTTSSTTTTTIATPVTTTPAPPTTAPLLGTPQTTTTAIQLIIVDPPPSTLLIDTTTTSPLLVQASDTLPRTGVNTDNLPWLALAALVAGAGLVRLTKGQES